VVGEGAPQPSSLGDFNCQGREVRRNHIRTESSLHQHKHASAAARHNSAAHWRVMLRPFMGLLPMALAPSALLVRRRCRLGVPPAARYLYSGPTNAGRCSRPSGGSSHSSRSRLHSRRIDGALGAAGRRLLS
jgi:hypothetical protein